MPFLSCGVEDRCLISLPYLSAVQSAQKGNCKEVPHDLAPETIVVEVTESREGFPDLPLAYKTKDADNTVRPYHSALKLTVCVIMPLESSFSMGEVLNRKIYTR